MNGRPIPEAWETLKAATDRLQKLLAQPEHGLMSWNMMVCDEMITIASFIVKPEHLPRQPHETSQTKHL